jgi:DNA polymerase-3 subunit gamma/tau
VTTALYRRYRPESFAEVIGQDHVTAPLRQALRSGQTNHAYLFSGPRGCGKTTSARILARCLNCAEGPTDTPCGVCPSCVELARGGPGSLDVVEIDAASHGGVDDARELRERATFAPARDRYKVFILDEAHMVSPQGFNALLKIVEEPPPHVKFIFATTEPDKVIGTIRSRTHHYPFRLVPPDVLVPYLEQLCTTEGVPVGAGVLSLVVRAGAGSVRDTLSVLDQLVAGAGPDGLEYEGAVALLGYTHTSLLDDLVDAIAARDGASAFRVVERVVATGHEPRRFVEDLLERLRDLIVIAASGEAAAAVLRDVPADQLDRMRRQATHLGPSELSRSADLANAALTEMVGATSPRLHLELLMARLLLPSADDSTTGLGARVDRLERGLPAVPTGAGSSASVSAPATAVPVQPHPSVAAPAPAGHAPAGPVAGLAPASSAPAPAEAPVRPGAASASGPAAAPPAPTPDGPADPRTAADPAPGADPLTAADRVPAADPAPGGRGPAQHPAADAAAASRRPDATEPPAGPRDAGAEPTASTTGAPGGTTPHQDAAQHDAQQTAARDERVRDAAASWDAASTGAASTDAASTGTASTDAASTAAASAGTASTDAATPSARPAPAPVAAPEPAAPATAPAATAPAAAVPGVAAAAADTEMLRRRWPDVLTTLRRLRLPSWALVNQHAQILELDATTLRLGFAQPGLVTTFRNSNHADVVARALAETLGVTARVEAVLDEPGGGRGQAGPAGPAAPTPQVPDVISPERAAASWGDPAPAAPAPAASDAPPAADAARGAAPATGHDDARPAPVGAAAAHAHEATGAPDRPAGRADDGPGDRPAAASGPAAAPVPADEARPTDEARPAAGATRPTPPWEPDPAAEAAGAPAAETATAPGSATPQTSDGRPAGAATPAAPAPGAPPVVAHPHDDDIPPGDEPDDPWRDGPPRASAPRAAAPTSQPASQPARGAAAPAPTGRPAQRASAPAAGQASAPVAGQAPAAPPPLGPGATARERGVAAARAAAAQSASRVQEPDEPSPDDPTIGQSNLVGVQLVAQVLGGRVIDEQTDI